MKIFGWIADFLLVLVFIVGSTISALDTFGILSLQTVFGMPVDPLIARVTLLLLCTLGIVLIIERRRFLSKIDERVIKIDNDTTKICFNATETLGTLQNIKQIWLPAKILKTREETYLAFAEVLKATPSGTNVSITHFEKYRGAPYIIGEVEAEKKFMEQWNRRMKQGDLFVRHIIHVTSTFDLKEVEDRVKRLQDISGYSLNVMYGPPIRPFLDFAVIRDQWALLHLPSDSMSPFEAAVGLEFRNPEMVKIYERYFDIWWSRFSIPIKDRDGLKQETLLQLRDMLPDQAAEAWLDQAFELSLRIAKEKNLYEAFSDIANEFTSIEKIPVSEILKREFERLILETRDKIHALSNTTVELEPSEGTLVLLSIFEKAKHRVWAVSYDLKQDIFWESTLGKRLMRANAQAIKDGVDITRIFILTQEESTSRRVKAIIEQHKKIGAKVLIAKASELPYELIEDYLIQDDRLVFRMEVLEKGGIVHKCWISINSAEVQKRMQSFNLLRMRSVDQ